MVRFVAPTRYQPYKYPSFRRSRPIPTIIPLSPHYPSGNWGGTPISLLSSTSTSTTTSTPPKEKLLLSKSPSLDVRLFRIFAHTGAVLDSFKLGTPPSASSKGSITITSVPSATGADALAAWTDALTNTTSTSTLPPPVTLWSYASSSVRAGCWGCLGCGYVVPKSKSRCPECLKGRGEACNTLLIDQWRCVHCGNVHDTSVTKKPGSGHKSKSPLAGLEHHCNSCGQRACPADEYALKIEGEEALVADALAERKSLEEERRLNKTTRFNRKSPSPLLSSSYPISSQYVGKDVDGGGVSKYAHRMSELDDPDQVTSILSDDMLWKSAMEDDHYGAGDIAMLRDDEVDTLQSHHSFEEVLDTKSHLYSEGRAASAGGGIRSKESLKLAEEHGKRLSDAAIRGIERSLRKTPPAIYAAYATSISSIVMSDRFDEDILRRGCGTLYMDSEGGLTTTSVSTTDNATTPTTATTKKGRMSPSAIPLSESEAKSLTAILKNSDYKPVHKAYPCCFDSRLVVIRPKWSCPGCKHNNSAATASCSRCTRIKPA